MITTENVIKLHTKLIEKTGGIDGLRDKNLLESALYAPYQTFGGQEQYPGIEEKAAKYAYSIIKNHAFVDGNKRIGVLIMLLYLESNKVSIKTTDNDLVTLGLSLANNKFTYEDTLQWIINHKK